MHICVCVILAQGPRQERFERKTEALAGVPRSKDRWNHGLAASNQRLARALDGPYRPQPGIVQADEVHDPRVDPKRERGVYSPCISHASRIHRMCVFCATRECCFCFLFSRIVDRICHLSIAARCP